MKTFQDIMKEHPVTVTQNTGIHEASSDTLTHWYNMWWGTLTDTHMELLDDGTYVIVGSRLSKAMWDHIKDSRRLMLAPNTVLPHKWTDVMALNNLTDAVITYRGALAIAIGHMDEKPVSTIEIPPATTVSTPPMRSTCGWCDPWYCCGDYA